VGLAMIGSFTNKLGSSMTSDGVMELVLNSGKEIFFSNEVNNLLNIIYSVNDLCDNEKLFKALLVNFLQIDTGDLFRLNREIRERKLDKKKLKENTLKEAKKYEDSFCLIILNSQIYVSISVKLIKCS